MAKKTVLSGILVVCLFAGTLFALSGATPTVQSRIRWSGDSASSIVTEGGNITAANISGSTLTDRWAAFYGNITGTVALKSAAATIFSWTWAVASGGEVCASELSSTGYTTGLTAASAANINTAYSMGTTVDNATNTMNVTNCTMNFAQATVASAPYVKHSSKGRLPVLHQHHVGHGIRRHWRALRADGADRAWHEHGNVLFLCRAELRAPGPSCLFLQEHDGL
jgi:hypothetical protein